MEAWLAHIDEYGKALKEQKRPDLTQDRVKLMTMHGAKGLEFDTVFVIHGNEGCIPYKKAKLETEIEEERRLFYVAMTRAKNKLVISYVKEKTERMRILPVLWRNYSSSKSSKSWVSIHSSKASATASYSSSSSMFSSSGSSGSFSM